MGLFDRFRGAGVQRPALQEAVEASDDQAVARYRYMLRTAPPDTIEQAMPRRSRSSRPSSGAACSTS